MSKSKLIALAITAALAAPNAYAISINDGGPTPGNKIDPSKIASIDVKDATTAVTVAAVDIYVSPTDLIIGRTTGFSVRLDLQDGAKFNAAPAAPTVGAALAGGGIPWTATLAAGGAAGDTFAVYSVQPGGGSTGVVNGAALKFAGLALKNVAGLGAVGGSASVKVTFADPGTAQPILDPKTAVLANAVAALKADVGSPVNTAIKIDVGSTATIASKTRFSSTGAIGLADKTTFEAGTLTVGVNAGVLDATGAAFLWAGTDKFDLTLDGSFAAFVAAAGGKVRLGDVGCVAAATDVPGTVTATKVSFAGVTQTAFAATDGALCFDVKSDNKLVIEESPVVVDVVATRTATAKSESDAGNKGLTMDYNGSQAAVWNFNPGSNVGQQSYLRITNPSALAGKVTVAGVCDSGAKSATAATFILGAGETKTITAQDLENGSTADGVSTTLGACTGGKWRLDVTGEFAGMRVQNFLRNNMSSGIINTSVNNTEY